MADACASAAPPIGSRAAMRVLPVVAAVLALALAGTLLVGRLAGRFLVVSDPLPVHADAIVIVAGSMPDRTLEAIDLYRAGVAPRIVVTREKLPRGEWLLRARGVRFPESDERTLAALAQLGVPPAAVIHLRRRNHSTESEARTVARWACRRHVGRLVAVTSRPHSRRLKLIFARALGPGVALTVRPTRYDPFAPGRWWRIRRDAKLVLTEYVKLAHYWLEERWQIHPCGGLHRHAQARQQP